MISKISYEKEHLRLGQLFQQPWVQIIVLLVFCSLLFILGVGRWDLWNPDEPRYAQVAKEMVARGDWILMHVNGNTYVDKPPLFFWLIALSSSLWQGFTSFSARFPSAFLSTLTVLLTFFLGKKLYSSRTGFLSALILATSFEFAYLSTRANIDATLTFFTTTSIFFFLHWYQNSKGEGDEEKGKRSLSIYGFYIGMALATLAKGPVGFILPLLVSLVYLLVQKDWKAMKRMRLMTGMALFLMVVLSWYLPAVLKGGQDFLNETLLHQTIDRFAKGSSHIRPVYYFLSNFPVDFLPWFLFLPGAIVYGLSKRKEGILKDFLFLLVWFVVIFLFFSFSKGKRAIYLLPLYPAASLLVGRFWDDYLSGSGRFSVRKTWITLPVFLFIIVFFLMGVFLYAIPAVAEFSIGPSTPKILKSIIHAAGSGAKYLSYVPRWSVFPFIMLLVGSSILLTLSQALKYKSLVFILLAATAGMGFFYTTRVIFPLVNPYKSARFISQEIVQTMKNGGKLVIYGDSGSAVTSQYNFYSGIVPILEIEDEKEIIDLFHSKEKVFCLAEYDDYERLIRKYTDLSLNLITRRGVGSRDMVLVSNR
ncbi:MAG: glycosyltransferase family 39 protein [Desulfobacterales bacterium]|nr:glycosyltransferase family 39 protein [Desulfobacterales bacterium]